jgi:hypothetical protein
LTCVKVDERLFLFDAATPRGEEEEGGEKE